MTTDFQIQQDAMLALQREPSLRDGDIAIAVREGIVTLAGFTRSYSGRYLAEHLVSLVRGVKGIANDLEARSPSPSARLDSDIARAAVHALRWHPRCPKAGSRSVERGWVRLRGEAMALPETAELAVSTGVTGVSNRITIKAPPVPASVLPRGVVEQGRNQLTA
jgi:osmotically-inducible protein OsmY